MVVHVLALDLSWQLHIIYQQNSKTIVKHE